MGKNKLYGGNSVESVNKRLYNKISLDSDSKELPYNDINKIINENEVFDRERLLSSKYRLTIKINTLFSNVLFNATGKNSWETFTKPIMRDRSYPPNEISINEDEDFTIYESIKYHLKEVDGWFGYYDPAINSSNRFLFNDMEPNRDKFNLISKEDKNWDIIVCYPNGKSLNNTIEGGLSIESKSEVVVGGENMINFATLYNHNLKVGDKVKLKNISGDGVFRVEGIGLNSEHLNNYFSVRISNDDIFLSDNSRFCKMVNGVESEYYLKTLKPVKTINGEDFNKNDGDISNLAFSKNIFNDQITQFVTKTDIDVEGLVDNLGRPLTEIFITIVKRKNKGFGKICNGLDLEHINETIFNKEIPNIHRVHNGIGYQPFNSSLKITDDITIDDDEFIGDLVEYNKMSLKETVICNMMHRFNTLNREFEAGNDEFGKGKRQEGYYYKPFHKLKIKEFSNYIEKGDEKTYGIPKYAEQLNNGDYIWRDLMVSGDLDHPFTNGFNYVYDDVLLNLRRQDPFNVERLTYQSIGGYHYSDIPGNEINDNHKIKNSEDGC